MDSVYKQNVKRSNYKKKKQLSQWESKNMWIEISIVVGLIQIEFQKVCHDKKKF